MLRVLLRGALNVSEMSKILGLSQSNVSHNLRKLLDAGLVIRRGRGSWAYYDVNRRDPVTVMLAEVISRGVKQIENYDADMCELRRCYDQRRREAREFFDRMAEEIEGVSHLMPDPEDYIHEVMERFDKEGTVLDAGCGNGVNTLRLLEKGFRVIGVDQSQEMLSKARKRIASVWASGDVELRLGNAEHLPLADNSVDGVLAHMLLHHLGDPPEFFVEAARVCRRGGRCSVVELHPHDDFELKRVQGDLWPGLEKEDVKSWMEAAGFDEIEDIEAGGSCSGRVFILTGILGGSEKWKTSK